MYEKVNPAHPDKVADRIAGALVDMAYAKQNDPRIAVEVLIGHGKCHIISETSVLIDRARVERAVKRIAGNMQIDYVQVKQDEHLAENQAHGFRCGDNGIFKGVPVTREQKMLTRIARANYDAFNSDGKYIIDGSDKLVICQSNMTYDSLSNYFGWDSVQINPLGNWTGGTDVDTGATNRKLGSDMGDSVTGGGLHGKDLSKADVSVNIYAWLKAQETGRTVEYMCAIGDLEVDGIPYYEIVETARNYIKKIGGFEKFAEWGLIR